LEEPPAELEHPCIAQVLEMGFAREAIDLALVQLEANRHALNNPGTELILLVDILNDMADAEDVVERRQIDGPHTAAQP
jgi:hypothetical protein